MKFGLCPKLDSCSRIKTARLNRARICCRIVESLESICARCEAEQEASKKLKRKNRRFSEA